MATAECLEPYPLSCARYAEQICCSYVICNGQAAIQLYNLYLLHRLVVWLQPAKSGNLSRAGTRVKHMLICRKMQLSM